MAETLAPQNHQDIDLQGISSRLKELSQLRRTIFSASECSADEGDDARKLLEDCNFDVHEKARLMDTVDRDVEAMTIEDLEAFMDELNKEVSSTMEESSRISAEIDIHTRAVAEDSALLDGDLEALTSSLDIFDSQGLVSFCSSSPSGNMLAGDTLDDMPQVFNNYNFEILELTHQIEMSKMVLKTLQDLDCALKRLESIVEIENMLSEVRVLEFEGSRIRLSLKTHIPSDGFFLRHKLDFLVEPSITEHELLIEVIEGSTEPKALEIIPNDISVDGIIDCIKSSRDFSSSTTFLAWCMRQIQRRIILCTLRQLLVKDANKSRHFFEYSDRDGMVTAQLVGGVTAFIKLAVDWPMSGYPLKLVSIQNSNQSISLSFLCKVKETANLLDTQIRSHLVQFVDAIEEVLVQEMQSELHLNKMVS